MPAKRKPVPARPVLQRLMAAVGMLVALAVVVVVGWDALQSARPPALTARVVRVTTTEAGRVAEIEVVNAGSETAAAVDVEGVLGAETATATIDYVPGRGRATAFLRFDGDPRAARVAVKGWSAP